MSDDARTLAGLLRTWATMASIGPNPSKTMRAAAKLLRDLADENERLTAERDDLAARLAVAEAAHLATYETVSRRADAAESRLAALLDAIGDLSGGWTVREGEMILDRIADAVDGPT